MAINYEYYKIFYYVAKYRNLTQAAAALFSNQPNVTRVMKQLESELGCQLLIRTNKGIKLTEEGERLYSHVEVAFEQLQNGEEELLRCASLKGGVVSIGTTETALHMFLLDRLEEFRKKYPDVRLKIHNYTTPQAILNLKNGLIDFAVITSPINISVPLKTVKLQSFQDILVGGTMYEEFSKSKHKLSEIQDFSFITLEKDTVTFEFFNKFFYEHDMELKPDVEVATADLIIPMIIHNLGVGFIPGKFARLSLSEKKVFEIEIEEKIPERGIYFVYDTKRSLSMASNTLKMLLLDNI